MVIINVEELASNLAHNRTLTESGDICNNEDDMYTTESTDDDNLIYKEEIQDRFNNWYDYYYTEIMKAQEPKPTDVFNDLLGTVDKINNNYIKENMTTCKNCGELLAEHHIICPECKMPKI